MKQNVMSIKDYYDLIEKEAKVLKIKIGLIEKDIKALQQISDIKKGKFGDLAQTSLVKLEEISKSNIKLINLLKALFGEKFFDQISEEELKKAKEKGLFTPESLDDFIGRGYGNNYGFEFKRPTSWQEFAEFIRNCLTIFKDLSIRQDSKENYYVILFTIKGLTEQALAKNITDYRELQFVYKTYDNFINAYKKEKKLEISDSEASLIKTALNKKNRKFIKFDNDKEEVIDEGEAYLIFAEDYNAAIDEIETKKRANKYFKKLKKIKFEKLENKNLPEYTDPEFKPIINDLMDMFSKEEDCEKILAVLSAHYIGYYKTLRYTDENIEKSKTL